MYMIQAREEYAAALKAGQRELRELRARRHATRPAVLDDLISDIGETIINVGMVEIPADRIVGTKSAGRITAFTPGFRPLLDPDSEFAHKWVNLCAAHLSEEGIREPIVCYEYLGNFYVQEGNKRVSVLRHFGAPKIPGYVYRLMPQTSQEPHIRAYFEFLEFYDASGIYDIQFHQPGYYAKLLAHLGKEPGEKWTEREQKTFRAYYQYFLDAFYSLGGGAVELLPEEGLLLWLRVYPFQDLGRLSATELKKAMTALKDNLVALEEPVKLETEPVEQKQNLLTKLISTAPEHLHVAFIHSREPSISTWITGHEEGIQHLKEVMGSRLTVRSYFHADTPEKAEELLDRAVEKGAEVVFTTTPQLSRATLKAAVKYPRVKFLNCSVDAPYSSVRTYYGRVFEGKFITGAIAGAMSNNDSIGYIGSYPIFGVPAAINAFALGAQMTNPRAKIQLRWSCLPGNPVEDFREQGIYVISNRDVPTPDQFHLEGGGYGTYVFDENGVLVPMASPCWVWGKFYEHVIDSIFEGSWEQDKSRAVNYWWGMDSGVIDVTLSEHLPEGLHALADILREGMRSGKLDPFRRRLVAQDGTVINDGSHSLSTDELLHMQWLCENVEGSIPPFEDILPYSQAMVRELGVYRDTIPMEKEGHL